MEFGGVGGEPHQVVHDDMNRSADDEPVEIGKIERFGHNPLTCEGAVAVQNHRNDSCVILVRESHLPCSRAAENDGIDRLEVVWVRDELYDQRLPIARVVGA